MEEIGQGFGNAVAALCVSVFTIESAINGNENLKECYSGAREHVKETMGRFLSRQHDYIDVLETINKGGTITCNVEQTPDLDSLLSKLAVKEHTYAIILVQSVDHNMDNTRWDKVIGVIGYDGAVPNYTFVDSSAGQAFKFTDLDFEARTYLQGFRDATFTMIRIQLVKPVEKEPTPKKPKVVRKREAPVVIVDEEEKEKPTKPVEKKKPKIVRKRPTKKNKEES